MILQPKSQAALFTFYEMYYANVLNQPSSLRRTVSNIGDFFSNPENQKEKNPFESEQISVDDQLIG